MEGSLRITETFEPLKILTFSSREGSRLVQNIFLIVKHVFHISCHVTSVFVTYHS